MADWWKRLMKPQHKPEASEVLASETVVRLDEVKDARERLQALLAQIQERREGNAD